MWGDVCDNGWDMNDTAVVCRELGFSGVLNYQKGAYKLSSFYILDGVQCSGFEDKLSSCQANPIFDNNCGIYDNVIVSCLNGELFGYLFRLLYMSVL